MSRPYLQVDAITYSAGVLSVDYTYFKCRGGGTISITGFSNSLSVGETHSNRTYITSTFSVPTTLGTNSATVYLSNASFPITFTGTVSTITAVSALSVQILGVNVISAATSSVGVTLSNYMNAVVGGASFTGAAAGFSVTSSNTGTFSTLLFSAPASTGNLYNTLTASITLTHGGGSFATVSTGTTFSGGLNQYPVVLGFPQLGGYSTPYNYNI